MKKLVVIMVSILMGLMVLTGCGSKTSPDKQKAEEAIAAYESYRSGDLSSDDAMQKILLLSTEIEDKEIATRVSTIVSLMAFEGMNGTDNTDKHINDLKDYLENGATSTTAKGDEQASADQTPEDILKEANKFISDCWNPICDLDWYVSRGTSSTGGDLDAEFTIAKFKDAYKDKDDICAKIDSLSDDEYAMAKQAFNKAIEEFERLNGVLDDTAFIVSSKNSGTTLGVSTLQDYVRTFSDQVWDATH